MDLFPVQRFDVQDIRCRRPELDETAADSTDVQDFDSEDRSNVVKRVSTPKAVTTSVFGRRDYVVFGTLTTFNVVAISFLLTRWMSFHDWRREPLIFLPLSVVLLTYIGIYLSRWILLPMMRRPILMAVEQPWRVGVATTFVSGPEPLTLLEKSVKALVALDYPHDTWVLDEGDDERVRAICRKCGALHFSRKRVSMYQTNGGAFKSKSKFGNYNAWLSEIGFQRYDVIAAFDPDHGPEPKFLGEVLGYFEDPSIGYVQVAQAYANQGESWIARGAAEETYDYFSTIQMASYGMGYPILVGGHNVHRVAALRSIGGFAAHDADDILTTQHYRNAGWQGVYVPRILARGINPLDWRTYLTQQRRWARSVLDVKFRVHAGLAGKTPLLTRLISFVHGFNYLAMGLLPAATLALIIVMAATGRVPAVLSSGMSVPILGVIGAMGLSEAFRQRFYLDPGSERGLHWRAAILRWAKWPQMLFALGDVILNRRPIYEVTDKTYGKLRPSNWLWPHYLVALLLGISWGWGRLKGQSSDPTIDVLVSVVLVATVLMGISNRCWPNTSPKPSDAPTPG